MRRQKCLLNPSSYLLLVLSVTLLFYFLAVRHNFNSADVNYH